MARLTADNLEFMAKLQEAEAELSQLRGITQELKEAVQEQKGPWFEEVRDCSGDRRQREQVLCCIAHK